jgi:hypothetical protein
MIPDILPVPHVNDTPPMTHAAMASSLFDSLQTIFGFRDDLKTETFPVEPSDNAFAHLSLVVNDHGFVILHQNSFVYE